MKMRPKVLFISNQAPHYRIRLFNLLGKKLNIKFVFTHERKRVIKDLNAQYEFVRGLGKGKYKFNPSLLEIIKREKPNIVVLLPPDPLHLLDNLNVSRYCLSKGIPFIVWTVRWEYKNFPLKDKISDFFHKKITKKADKVLVPGTKAFEWVSSQGIKEKDIVITPNASEIFYDKKKGETFKKELISKYHLKGKKVIVYVGRLIRRKGIKYLIEAFAKIKEKNSLLFIVGGGDFYHLGEPSLREELLEIVKKYDLEKRIIFTGEVKNNLVPAIYELADVLVVPSITEKISEPWGLVVNEGMQFGLPVVATDAVGAAYDMVENGKNGFIVPEKDSISLKKAIEGILSNKKLRDRMSKESKKKIKEKYNYETMAAGLIKAVEEISKYH